MEAASDTLSFRLRPQAALGDSQARRAVESPAQKNEPFMHQLTL